MYFHTCHVGQGTAHERAADTAYHKGRLGHAQRASQFSGVRTVGNNSHGSRHEAIGKSLERPGRHELVLILAETAEKIGKTEQHRRPDGHLFLSPHIRQLPPHRTHDRSHEEATGENKTGPKGNFHFRHPHFLQVERQERNNHGVAGGNQKHTGYEGDDIFIQTQGIPLLSETTFDHSM